MRPFRITVRIFRGIRRRIRLFFSRRREYKITLEGIIFILITFFIGFAAINTNTNLLYLIMSMMMAFLILSGYLSTNTLRRISVKRLAVRHVSAKDEAMIQIEVRNGKKRMGSYSLRVMDYLATGEPVGAGYLFYLPARGREYVTYGVRFPRRGQYNLSRIRVTTRFPFGFFERSISVKQPQEILVYPQIINIQPVLDTANIDLGEYETGRKGHGTSLYGLREYYPGDSARFIHWKVSARTNKIMVREFEKEEKKKVTIVLDNHFPGEIPASHYDYFEKGVVYAASLAKYLVDREFQVQLVTASGRVPFGMGLSHLYRVLRALAMVQLEKKAQGPLPAPPLDAESTNIVIQYEHTRERPQAFQFAQYIDITKFKSLEEVTASQRRK